MNTGHVCKDIKNFPLDGFHQRGKGWGEKVLLIGESPSPNGWHRGGMACYNAKGKLLATGKRLNELLDPLQLSVDTCGFTELSKCYCTDRKELLTCSRKCWPIFLNQLSCGKYVLLIILGVGTTKIFTDITGQELPMGELRATVIGNKRYMVLPIYHPSPINPHGHGRNKEIFAKRFKEIMKSVA